MAGLRIPISSILLKHEEEFRTLHQVKRKVAYSRRIKAAKVGASTAAVAAAGLETSTQRDG